MQKKRFQLETGVKYRGYGYVNAFGEFEFTPEQTGSRLGRRRLVKEGDAYTIAETRNTRIVHITLPKGVKGLDLIKKFMEVVNTIVKVFGDYEI